MDNIIIKQILNHLNHKYIKQYYLGVYSVRAFNRLNIRNFDRFSLILFISNVITTLGHWIVIIKTGKHLFFCDSFGHSPRFYKKINNPYLEFDFYFNWKLQNDSTTICGGYAIFFIHLISACHFDIQCFANKIQDIFKYSQQKKSFYNDKIIVKYIFKIYPHISKEKCKTLFCNTKFIINPKQCSNALCNT